MTSTFLYFVLALLLLVIVHEYGHFQVARWCGVKVLRFSFGFGKVLARWTDKKGTEYAWSLIPLGGYVKMLDESEDEVPENEKHLAFNNQSIKVRTAIVLAGPLFNFLFAFVALWLVLIIGRYSLAPMIDSVAPGSIAAQAGLTSKQEIIALDGTEINSWNDFHFAIMPYIGSEGTVNLTIRSITDNKVKQISLPLSQWKLNSKKPDPLKSLGIEPYIPIIPPVIGVVSADSPAEKAGIKVHDEIVSINGKAFNDWLFLVDFMREHPNTQITIGLKRKGKIINIAMMTGSKMNDGKVEGFVGLGPQKPDWPAHLLRLEREGYIPALGTALKQTVNLASTTLTLMGRLVTGRLPLENISGPVGIAQGAGESGRSGIVSYLFFLALVSISLGVLNLLPIPMLDGGHLLYYVIEAIRGKPLSERSKTIGVYCGIVLLLALMCVAITNDISRLVG